MKKAILAATVGLALVGGQAVAQNSASARVGDRVGPQAGETSEFAGAIAPGLIFAAITVASFVFLIEVVSDDSESD